MNLPIASLRTLKVRILWRYVGIYVGTAAFTATAGLLLLSGAAIAHHPSGGGTPDNPVDAFLSGVGHPVIGLDHLAFVIASGLLAAAMGRRLIIPLAFVVASLAGTGLHLIGLNLPALELVISASVLVFGILLSLKQRPNTVIAASLAAIAGVFHGYAYGEAIAGAQMGPLIAYLLGFTSIQLLIAAAAYGLGRSRRGAMTKSTGMALRFAGLVVCGVGGTLLSTLIVDSVLPGG